MKKIISIIAAMLMMVVGFEAYAWETPDMDGTIGKYKIKMRLNIPERGNKVTGWYYYKSKGPKNKIALNGTISGEIIGGNLYLTESVGGKKTGTIKAEFLPGNRVTCVSGKWIGTKGNTLVLDVCNDY